MNVHAFLTIIEGLPDKQKYEKQDLFIDPFLIEEEGDIEIYFAAHNEYVNLDARILIVGITPGWFQMERSIRLAKQLTQTQTPYDDLIKEVKRECRFAGSLRTNLLEMLDWLGLAEFFGIDCAADLFGEKDELLHTVSLVKYPVFVKGKNYTGHTPRITGSKLLMRYVDHTYETDIKPLDAPLIIPLGKAVEAALRVFIEKGWIQENQCLFGFPHPSGANGHRVKQFFQHKDELQRKIRKYVLN
ncbi:hypothetical protein [Alkalihalobacillus sp. AL-G]|uniref:hypothetical protein n=1 Tax=Alkalihalobacillus sp. AL-G TaxID=2926399 RepID=UPI0027297F85|nr:hypothetical protein [Alkalihalobacillus sp. AL-G]WLD93851.1 hypothetical protein MOJ78_02740 [Alkalihalobacillus sp. AL-G]